MSETEEKQCAEGARLDRLESEVFKTLHSHSELTQAFTECQNKVVAEIETVVSRLDEIEHMPREEHVDHHRLINRLILERQMRLDFWNEVRAKLAVAGIIGATGLLMTALGFAFLMWIKDQSGG